MPDWSYHTFFKPVLFRIKPETSRDFTLQLMNTLARLPLGDKIINFFGHMQPPLELEREIAGIRFPSPVGLSGALDSNLKGTTAYSNLGFGFIEVGPISLEPCTITEPIERNPVEETLWYEHLYSNIGLDEAKLKLQKLKRTVPMGIGIKGETEEELLHLAEKLDEYADFFIVDINAVDHFENIRSITANPIFLELTYNELDVNKFNDLEIDGFLLREGIQKDNGWELGKSEMPFLKSGIQQLLPFGKPIIASGGVHEPIDAMELFRCGASLVQLHSGFVFSGAGLPKRINERYVYENDEKTLEKTYGWVSLFLMGMGVFIAGIIALIIGLTHVLLPYDEAFLGIKSEEIIAYNHESRIISFHLT
jgi:dihydroorotate dehydrogenase